MHAGGQPAILKKCIYMKKQLHLLFNILDHSIDNIEHLLRWTALNQDKSATLSFPRLKTIVQFKWDMMTFGMTTVKEVIRIHANMIVDEKKKIIEASGGQVPIPKTLIQIMNAIAVHPSNMVQRS